MLQGYLISKFRKGSAGVIIHWDVHASNRPDYSPRSLARGRSKAVGPCKIGKSTPLDFLRKPTPSFCLKKEGKKKKGNFTTQLFQAVKKAQTDCLCSEPVRVLPVCPGLTQPTLTSGYSFPLAIKTLMAVLSFCTSMFYCWHNMWDIFFHYECFRSCFSAWS